MEIYATDSKFKYSSVCFAESYTHQDLSSKTAIVDLVVVLRVFHPRSV